ncbi:MAG: DUF4232 domain-containing protein [Acidimicrobiales bacterium]
MSPVRHAGVAAMLVAVAAMAAACSSPPTSPHSSPPGSQATTSTTASSTTTTAAGATVCAGSDLVGTVSGDQGAAGTTELTIALRNTSAITCGLEGYPGAQLNGSDGSALPTDVVRGGPYAFVSFAPTPVSLAPGASAYFNMGYSDVPTGTTACSAAASMWVTPPNDVDHVTITQQLEVCDGGRINVSPVFGANSPDTQTTAPPPS